MSKRKSEHSACEMADIAALRESLLTGDAKARAKAVRQVCPCRLGFDVFEEFLGVAAQLQKDPDAAVRASALHVFEDAYQMMSEGQPTSRRMVTDDMAATKFRSRARQEETPVRDKATPHRGGFRGRTASDSYHRAAVRRR